MKYVVTVVDPGTGKSCVRGVPTTKSHARHWANQYIKDGFQADIAPVESAMSVPGNEIKSAFDAEKEHRWDFVKVRFSWINMEDQVVNAYLSMRELYMDWHGECENCPENDAVIFNIQIGTTAIPNEATNGFRFEDLMALIEETWPPHKNGPRRPGTEPVTKKSTGRKRGRPRKVLPTG